MVSRAAPLKVAVPMMGHDGWMGGYNYLKTLLSVLQELPGGPIAPIVYANDDLNPAMLEGVAEYAAEAPILFDARRGRQRLLAAALGQRDVEAESMFRERGVEVVFQHSAWFGFRFGLPTLVWLPDFQHKHLPQMFSPFRRLRRDVVFGLLTRSATRILVSSEDARSDCERFYPRTREKILSLPFVVEISERAREADPASVRAKYGLPENFVYFPSQFWAHKNHILVLRALEKIREDDRGILVVTSGSGVDKRNRTHFEGLRALVAERGLHDRFRMLGVIPYEDVVALTRSSVALLNPSLFEGWSTTVEEAKSLGVPLLLSDLRVHREQTEGRAWFFDPGDPDALARGLVGVWDEQRGRDRERATALALSVLPQRRRAFGERLAGILHETAGRAGS